MACSAEAVLDAIEQGPGDTLSPRYALAKQGGDHLSFFFLWLGVAGAAKAKECLAERRRDDLPADVAGQRLDQLRTETTRDVRTQHVAQLVANDVILEDRFAGSAVADVVSALGGQPQPARSVRA